MSWPYKYSQEHLENAIRLWQPHYNETLTYQDAEEISDNMVKLFRLLHVLDEKQSGKG